MADIPIKLEIAKLSHSHVLQVVLPLAPGAVIVLGTALGDGDIARAFFEWNFVGYYTKIAVLVSVTYLLGISITAAVDAATQAVLFWIFESRIGQDYQPWKSPEWRRSVTTYLGDSMAPRSPGSEESENEWIGWYLAIKKMIASEEESGARQIYFAAVQAASFCILGMLVIFPVLRHWSLWAVGTGAAAACLYQQYESASETHAFVRFGSDQVAWLLKRRDAKVTQPRAKALAEKD